MDTGVVRRSNKGKNRVPLRALARVASVAVGVQFGWSLQLSLLTPYVQELGISHTFASYIWLCGPISGMLVQPIVGHYSDTWTGSWGRRRPFIASGAILVVAAVLMIGFSSDIGYILGDSSQTRIRAIIIFILGFWILDLANNTLQGPCRALLADFTGTVTYRLKVLAPEHGHYFESGNRIGMLLSMLFTHLGLMQRLANKKTPDNRQNRYESRRYHGLKERILGGLHHHVMLGQKHPITSFSFFAKQR